MQWYKHPTGLPYKPPTLCASIFVLLNSPTFHFILSINPNLTLHATMSSKLKAAFQQHDFRFLYLTEDLVIKKVLAEAELLTRIKHLFMGIMLVDSQSDVPAHSRSFLVALIAMVQTLSTRLTHQITEKYEGNVSPRKLKVMCDSAQDSSWKLAHGVADLFCQWYFNHEQMNQDLEEIQDGYDELQLLVVKEYMASLTALCFEQVWAAMQFKQTSDMRHRTLFTTDELYGDKQHPNAGKYWQQACEYRKSMARNSIILYDSRTLGAQIRQLKQTQQHQLTDLEMIDGPSNNSNRISTALVPYSSGNYTREIVEGPNGMVGIVEDFNSRYISRSNNNRTTSRSYINSSGSAAASSNMNSSTSRSYTNSSGSAAASSKINSSTNRSFSNSSGSAAASSKMNSSTSRSFSNSYVLTQKPASMYWKPSANQQVDEESGLQMYEIIQREQQQKTEVESEFHVKWKEDMRVRKEQADKRDADREKKQKELLKNRYVDREFPNGKWQSNYEPSQNVRDGMIARILERNDPQEMWEHRLCPPPQSFLDSLQILRAKKARKRAEKRAKKNATTSNSGSRLEAVFNTMTVTANNINSSGARTNNKHQLDDVYPDGDQEDNRDRVGRFARIDNDDRYPGRSRGSDKSDSDRDKSDIDKSDINNENVRRPGRYRGSDKSDSDRDKSDNDNSDINNEKVRG